MIWRKCWSDLSFLLLLLEGIWRSFGGSGNSSNWVSCKRFFFLVNFIAPSNLATIDVVQIFKEHVQIPGWEIITQICVYWIYAFTFVVFLSKRISSTCISLFLPQINILAGCGLSLAYKRISHDQIIRRKERETICAKWSADRTAGIAFQHDGFSQVLLIDKLTCLSSSGGSGLTQWNTKINFVVSIWTSINVSVIFETFGRRNWSRNCLSNSYIITNNYVNTNSRVGCWQTQMFIT